MLRTMRSTRRKSNTNFHVGLDGSMEPTPPPDVVAMTKFMYEERGAGSDALDQDVGDEHASRRARRYLRRLAGALSARTHNQLAMQGNMTHNVAGGIIVSTSVGGSAHGGLGPPIVEAHGQRTMHRARAGAVHSPVFSVAVAPSIPACCATFIGIECRQHPVDAAA